jgi:hypothetical protein
MAGAVVAGASVAFASCGGSTAGPAVTTNQGDMDSGLLDVTMGDTSTSPHDTGTGGDANACADASNGNILECLGLCTNPQTDIKNCGKCGNNCSTMGASAYCSGGSCVCNADAGSTACGTTCVDTLTDPDNCGACGHTCQNTGAACMGGYCQPTVIASPGQPIWAIVVDSARVWWTQPETPSIGPGSGALLRKQFGAGTTIDTVIANLNDPRGLAIDLINVYWVDYFDTSVNQLETLGGHYITDYPTLDGGAPSYRNPLSLAVDSTNIYWVSNFNGDILTVPIGSAGSVAPTVIQSGENHPVAIAVDADNVYWADEGSNSSAPYNGAVVQKAKTGGSAAVTLASGEAIAWGVATDGTSVYWIDHANVPDGAVKQVPVGGGTVITLAANEGAPYGIAIDSKKVYWTAEADNTVNGVLIGGGTPKQIYAVQQQSPTAITVDQSNIYWANLESGQILELTK